MSRARACRTLATIIAATSLVSCTWKTSHRLLQEVAPYAGQIHINLSCNGADSLALVDSAGHPAWAITRKPKDDITWRVPSNVRINSIGARSPGIHLPLDSVGTQGRTNGLAYQSRVKEGTPPEHYHYVIDVTCSPTNGNPDVHLLIDPEMIIRPH